jgi:hypothetical protein
MLRDGRTHAHTHTHTHCLDQMSLCYLPPLCHTNDTIPDCRPAECTRSVCPVCPTVIQNPLESDLHPRALLPPRSPVPLSRTRPEMHDPGPTITLSAESRTRSPLASCCSLRTRVKVPSLPNPYRAHPGLPLRFPDSISPFPHLPNDPGLRRVGQGVQLIIAADSGEGHMVPSYGGWDWIGGR